MAKPPSLESDAVKARETLDNALQGLAASDAALAGHSRSAARRGSINFPAEEALVEETLRLLDRWKSQVATLLTGLDAATGDTTLAFARLFDETAGQPSGGYLKRKVHLAHPHPAAIAADLENQLAAGAVLDSMLKAFRPELRKRHRECEDHLLRIIEQRQRVDFDIEDVQRQSDVVTLQITDRRAGIASGGSRTTLIALEEERKALVADRDVLHAKELEFKPERETLQRLISIYEDFVDALNTHIGVVNAMMGKLALDNEQRIALLKAAQVQLSNPTALSIASVASLVAAFDANVLAGHDLSERKRTVDAAFARRLEARAQPDDQPEEAVAADEAIAGA